MKVLALIQARMGSSRLPGKVLSDVLGKPMLQWQLERLKHSKTISQTVVATSNLSTDTPIADFCKSKGYACFRGSEDNVLSRFFDASLQYLNEEDRKTALVIRLTGDCPLSDPFAIDEGVEQFKKLIPSGCRYFGYEGDLPDGMDFEIFTWLALEEAHKLANDAFEKEHVTPYMWKNPEKFKVRRYSKAGITPGLRFSVDYPEDRDLAEELLKRELKTGHLLGMKEVSDLLTHDPKLREMNSKIIKNEGLLITSLKAETSKVKLNGKLVSKYGVALPQNSNPTEEFFEWAKKVGIDVWMKNSSDAVPPKWKIFEVTKDWKGPLNKLANESDVEGIFLKTADRVELAELLMFLCKDRFDYNSKAS